MEMDKTALQHIPLPKEPFERTHSGQGNVWLSANSQGSTKCAQFKSVKLAIQPPLPTYPPPIKPPPPMTEDEPPIRKGNPG